MSSAATAGSSNRSDGVNGGGPATGPSTLSPLKTSTAEGMNGRSRHFPHIEDLVTARPDVDINAPIRRLVLEAESYAKQADTHLDFNRPDFALQEHIKATIIAVDYIPRHKEYPELKAGHGDAYRLWLGVTRRLKAQQAKVEEIKNIIKQDNARTGVQPSTSRRLSTRHFNNPTISGPTVNYTFSKEDKNVTDTDQTHNHASNMAGSLPPSVMSQVLQTRKLPPPVQPKPGALVGNAIDHHWPSDENGPRASIEDLKARFARLRGTESRLTVQDPRIHTRPIVISSSASAGASSRLQPSGPTKNGISSNATIRPLGPREMPNVPNGPVQSHKNQAGLHIPSMPRAPDAIYSPARATELPEGISLPSSTPRGTYLGPRSTDSISSASGIPLGSTNPDDTVDYFSSTLGKPARIELSDSSTITADEVLELLKRGSQVFRVLFVDLRDRALFDAGHIMSQSIICIEPIVLRNGITAEDIGQSIILSPEVEQKLYEKRTEFDILVYYDQASISEDQGTASRGGYKYALRDFGRAIYDYSFEQQLKQRPRLLVGGLDAWVDLLGRGALAISNTSSARDGADDISTNFGSSAVPEKRLPTGRRTYESRPLTKEDEIKWDKALNDEAALSQGRVEDSEVEGWSYAKTTEDFLRRFPEVSPVQESMVVPRDLQVANQYQKTSILPAQPDLSHHHDELNAIMPRAPQRPSPAVPRPSYSGISEKSQAFTSVSAAVHTPDPTTISRSAAPRGRCGLENLGNTCFMNSVIQCLSATQSLTRYLTAGGLERSGKPPRNPQKRESTDPPQLMARHMANLLRHMWCGNFEWLSPKSIRQYVREISAASKRNMATGNVVYGDGTQQDAPEFLTFLLDNLQDETNMRRDTGPVTELTSSQSAYLTKQPLLEQARLEWKRMLHYDVSIVTHLFKAQETGVVTCNYCHNRIVRCEPVLPVNVPLRNDGDWSKERRNQQLVDALRRNYRLIPERLNGYTCDRCHRKDTSTTLKYISRCPEYFVFSLIRMLADNSKIDDTVTFPLDGLDLEPFFVPVEAESHSLEPEMTRPFKYSCYAVVQHRGRDVHSGHYWALIRDFNDPAVWWEMNDRTVRKVSSMRTQDSTSYVLFYRRSHSAR